MDDILLKIVEHCVDTWDLIWVWSTTDEDRDSGVLWGDREVGVYGRIYEVLPVSSDLSLTKFFWDIQFVLCEIPL